MSETYNQNTKNSHIILWLPCVLYYAFITLLSSISGQNFASLIYFPFPYFDKLVHFILYALLGAVLARALYLNNIEKRIKGSWMIYFVLIILSISFLDELHQYYVPNRSMQTSDWVVDNIGAIFGGAFYVLMLKRFAVGLKSLPARQLRENDMRVMGAVLAMTYFVVLVGFNILNYKQGLLTQYAYLGFVFMLIEFGVLGLFTIRYFYLRRDRLCFHTIDWLKLIIVGCLFLAIYQMSLVVLKNGSLSTKELLWSLCSYVLGAVFYYFDKQIEKFRNKVLIDPIYKRKTWQRAYFFIPPFFIAGLIVFLSCQSSHSVFENGIVLTMQNIFWKKMFLYINKVVFFPGVDFFILGLFYFRAILWESWWHSKKSRIQLWSVAHIIIILFAFIDQHIQVSLYGVMTRWYEGLMNVAGAAIAMSLYLFLYRRLKKRYLAINH